MEDDTHPGSDFKSFKITIVSVVAWAASCKTQEFRQRGTKTRPVREIEE